MGVRSRWQGASLARRVFVSLVVSIVATAVIVMTLSGIYYASTEDAHQRELHRVERFMGGQVEQVWDDPVARERLLVSIATELAQSVHLSDPDGAILWARGAPCSPAWRFDVPVYRGDALLGKLEICGIPRAARRTARALIFLAIMLIALWIASAITARALSQPLRHLAELASALGRGDLSQRARGVSCSGPEVAALASALDEMADRIERQLREQRELLAAVSHELRTPLGHLRLLAELGRERGGMSASQLGELERELLEMDELVDQLLVSSRLDFGLRDVRALDVTDLTVEAMERLGLDITLLDVRDVVQVRGDATLLGRALANVLHNGAQHGGGVTAVRVEARDAGVAILVEDDGPGLPEDEVERLCEPFVQRLTSPTTRGLGLGLYLVTRVCAVHQGRVILEARQRAGARIGLWLPLADTDAPRA